MTNDEFENLIIQQKNRLYRFAFSILKNCEEAEDAVQEIVLKLWSKRLSLQIDKNIESFCMQSVKNHCFDVLRKRTEDLNYKNKAILNFAENLNFENIDLVEKIKIEVQNLSTQQRMAIELKDFQGYDYDEISEILEMSVNSIRVNVSRGRKKLYEIFKEELKNG